MKMLLKRLIYLKIMWKKRKKKLNNFLENKLVISTSNYIYLLDIDEIAYLKSASNYTKVIMKDGKEIVASKTLKYFEYILRNKAFLRVHSSYLVNMKFIQGIKRNGKYTIELINKTSILVSRGFKGKLFNNCLKK